MILRPLALRHCGRDDYGCGAYGRQLLHGLQVEPAPVLHGLQVQPALDRRPECAIRACSILTSRSIIARAASRARTRIARAASTARTRGSRWERKMCAKGTEGPQRGRRACHFFLVRSVTYVSDPVWTHKKWWTAGDSNPRPPRCERGVLPAELAAHGHDLAIKCEVLIVQRLDWYCNSSGKYPCWTRKRIGYRLWAIVRLVPLTGCFH